ncbi:MAG: hypothetical protein AB1698_21115 [Pseudomonadota bacterium]
MKSPVAILAFNRPEYLKETLRSLERQISGSLEGREVHLFQDGIVSPVSGRVYAEVETVKYNINEFLNVFPQGFVHVQGWNKGIAEHFNYVERYFFEINQFEAAIFLEDDMVLSEFYLSIMDELIDYAKTTEKIGYVAAYGNHYAPLDAQLENKSKIIDMHHHWAFALLRRQWLRQKPLVDEYLTLISGVEYKNRDHIKIIDFFTSKGFLPFTTSQDAVKGAIAHMTGATRLMTFPCYGKYIGRTGMNFTEKAYELMKFDTTIMCDSMPEKLDWPSTAELDNKIAELQAAHIANLEKIDELFPFYRTLKNA